MSRLHLVSLGLIALTMGCLKPPPARPELNGSRSPTRGNPIDSDQETQPTLATTESIKFHSTS